MPCQMFQPRPAAAVVGSGDLVIYFDDGVVYESLFHALVVKIEINISRRIARTNSDPPRTILSSDLWRAVIGSVEFALSEVTSDSLPFHICVAKRPSSYLLARFI